MDYELEIDGKKIVLPDSMVQPRADLSELPDAPVKKKRVRKKPQMVDTTFEWTPTETNLQEAINALPPGGGTVHVPEGAWEVTTPIALPNAPINIAGGTNQPLQTMPPNLADYLNIHAGAAALGGATTPADPNALDWKTLIGGAIGMVGSAIVASMFKK